MFMNSVSHDRAQANNAAVLDPDAEANVPSRQTETRSPQIPVVNPEKAHAEPKENMTLPHRSHDPQYNQKRSDPFQFGSRYLQQDDDVFEFNAWDHVETDDAYKEYAEAQYAKQRENAVSDYDKKRFNSEPAKWWNLFYKNNTSNFFKNRKWLLQEFPILSSLTGAPESCNEAQSNDSRSQTILLEVGAGAGNTAFPILSLNKNPNLKIHACDFSKKAVELIRGNEQYDERYIQASVWDVASASELPEGLTEGSVDVVMMIFIFSALEPVQWDRAVQNVRRLLKPGGEVLFRDYGRGDLAQVRFKKGRYLDENFYVRGDGTRVYFFERDQLAQVWSGLESLNETISESFSQEHEDSEEQGVASEQIKLDQNERDSRDPKPAKAPLFEILDLGVDRRLLVNRQRKLKMYRCWLQGRFRKSEVVLPEPSHGTS